MPEDLAIIDIEAQVKEVSEGLRDLLEDIQILGIDIEELMSGNSTDVWQDYEDLCATRRSLAEKFQALRLKLKYILKF